MIKPIINFKEMQKAFQIFYLRQDRSVALLSGQAREYARLSKEHAKICVDNFELSKRVRFPSVEKVPMFSIFGLNIIKVSLCERFRPKTMKEIMYKKMLWADKVQKNYEKMINMA